MGTEIKVADNYGLVVMSEETAEMLREEMSGLGTISFDRIKIPTGGGIAFEVPGDDEDHPMMFTELTGVIAYHHPSNSYWEGAYGDGSETPDCYSRDGQTGVTKYGEIRQCAFCPENQFANGKKECKNMHILYLLQEGNPVPVILSIPPTSLKGLKDYFSKRLLLRGMRPGHVITKITLKREKNKDGINYSRTVFTLAGKLPEEQIVKVDGMKNFIKTLVESNETLIESNEALVEPEEAVAEGFVEVLEGQTAFETNEE